MKTIRILLLFSSISIFCYGQNTYTLVTTDPDNYEAHNVVRLSSEGDTLSVRTYISGICKPIPNGAVLSGWNSDENREYMRIYKEDSLVYERFFYKTENYVEPCESNNPDFVVVSLIDPEIECFTDTMSFLCYNLKTGEEHWCAIRGDRLDGPEKRLNVKFAYFEWYPRGAGSQTWSIVLRIIDLRKRTVTDLPIGSNFTAADDETSSQELPVFQLQWKDTRHICYLTKQYNPEPAILRIYSYNCSRGKLKREKLICNDISDVHFRYGHGRKLYLKTNGWLYQYKGNKVRSLFRVGKVDDFQVE